MSDRDLSIGTVAFLFTDIESSTKRWEHHPEAMKAAVERHDAILRHAIEANSGYVFRTEVMPSARPSLLPLKLSRLLSMPNTPFTSNRGARR